MDPVTQEVIIARPREEVFEYLADIANHAEFSDHYLVDWHLTREDSYGLGAGARYRARIPLNRFSWADASFVEVQPPRLIVERGRSGKFNRNLQRAVWELEEASGGTTRVRLTMETKPAKLSDKLMESLGARGWYRRKNGKALRRLRSILEEGEDRGARVTVAGGPRKPASAFRFRPDVNR
ncbi:MAG TPA: SRPBCC family protein [Baekduia sp.]|nr:SRPBCC family protein [Baekduia sp.]